MMDSMLAVTNSDLIDRSARINRS